MVSVVERSGNPSKPRAMVYAEVGRQATVAGGTAGLKSGRGWDEGRRG
ncbi:hypothetical protein [Actinocrispum sp. NPDC049592]